MSSFASIALPGGIPAAGSGCGLSPDSLFSSPAEKAAYQRLLESASSRGPAPDVKINKVCVRIFDLSSQKQREEYEKLWAELLQKVARMEAVVESRKDLVTRKDGTSYWMKYVEYVEFGDASEGDKKSGGVKNERR